MLFASFLSSQKGSARAARAQKDFILLKNGTDCRGAKAPRNDGGVETDCRTPYGVCNDRAFKNAIYLPSIILTAAR